MKDISKRAAEGARWTGISTVTSILLRMGQTAILARLLLPQDFGLLAMAMTVVGLARIFAEMGVTGAVIPRQEEDPERLSTLYWTNLGIGVISFAAVAALSPVAASFYGREELVGITISVATLFLIAPFGSLQRVLIQKRLDFRSLAVVEIVAELVGALLAVICAVRGLGVYSFVIGMIGRGLVSALLFASIERSWKPSLHWRRADLEGYLSFGMFQLGGRFLTYLSWSADKILIGRLLGEEMLGFYQIAWNLMLRPMSALGQVTHRVFFPLFSRIRTQPERLGRAYLRLLHAVAFASFPIYLGLFVVAVPFIEVYLGIGWEQTAAVLRVLVLLGMLHAVGNPLGSLLTSIERADAEFYMNLVVLVLTLPAIWFSAPYGLTGIAWTLLGIELLLFYPLEAWIRLKLVGLPLYSGALAVARPLLASVAMAAVVSSVGGRIGGLSVGRELAILIAVGVVCYTSLALAFERGFLRDLRGMLGKEDA